MDHPLKIARKARGLTQAQLGALCDLDHSVICRIERGGFARATTIQAIARALGVDDYRTLLPEAPK